MHDEPLRVLEIIQGWHDGPYAREPRVRDGWTPQVKLPPQITWTLLGLISYWQRNRWAWRALQRPERASLLADDSPGGSTTAKSEQVIKLGGSEWSCLSDGGFRRLTNRATGERLHLVDHEDPDLINSLRFREHIVSRREISPPQRRLLQLFPNGRGMVPALYALRAAGMFRGFMDLENSGLQFKLCRQVELYDQAVRAFLNAWADESNRVTLGALIGDHLAVAEIAQASGKSELAEQAMAEAADSQRRWLYLLRYLAGNYVDEDLLWALAEAKPVDFLEYLTAALEEDYALSGAAEEIIQSNPDWREQFEDVS